MALCHPYHAGTGEGAGAMLPPELKPQKTSGFEVGTVPCRQQQSILLPPGCAHPLLSPTHVSVDACSRGTCGTGADAEWAARDQRWQKGQSPAAADAGLTQELCFPRGAGVSWRCSALGLTATWLRRKSGSESIFPVHGGKKRFEFDFMPPWVQTVHFLAVE